MSDTRLRLVTSTNELFRTRGYHGTSVKDVTVAASATTGSLYHFFPGGKAELAEAVLRESGEAYRLLFEAVAAEADGPVEAVVAFFDGAAEVVEAIDFVDPCPIGIVAREVASVDDALRDACASVFTSWYGSFVDHLTEAGVDGDEAAALARVAVATLEGAYLLARTHRDATVMRDSGRMVAELVAARVPAPAPVAGARRRG